MPFNGELHRNGRVVVYTMTDPLTLDELASVVLHFEPIFQERSRHVIADATRLTRFPFNTLSFFFNKTRLSDRVSRPDFGYTILAKLTPAIRVMAGIAKHIVPADKIFTVGSLDEAWAKMEEILAKETASKAWD